MPKFVNRGGEKYGDVNCALCTIAAICKTDSLTLSEKLGFKGHQREGSFAKFYRRTEGIKEKSDADVELQEDFDGIMKFVEAVKVHLKKPVYVAQGGSYRTPVPLPIQTELMHTYPEGTEFAIWGSLGFIKGMGAHWNYAIRTATGIEYRDYQYNTSRDIPYKKSDKFIAPKGHEDETNNYTIGIVLIFSEKTLTQPFEKT